MAKSTSGQPNFTVQIGENAGSSGGLGKAFGFGFAPNDSVQCTYWDMDVGYNDTMISAIQLNHWYQCAVEVNFTDSMITYYLEGAVVRTLPFPKAEFYGIDRVLVFSAAAVPPATYFADDITLYTKR
jgi:hypothetical protein